MRRPYLPRGGLLSLVVTALLVTATPTPLAAQGTGDIGAQDTGTQQDDSVDQSPQDQAPAAAPDDAHWWLKRGGSGSGDLGTIIPLQVGYERFWQWRSGGLEQLDTWFLEECMFGAALAREEATVQGFKTEGKAQVVVIENHPQIWYATPEEAVIYDPYVNRSYFVDAKTRAPLGDGPNTASSTASVAFHLTKHMEEHGKMVWMVDDTASVNFE